MFRDVPTPTGTADPDLLELEIVDSPTTPHGRATSQPPRRHPPRFHPFGAVPKAPVPTGHVPTGQVAMGQVAEGPVAVGRVAEGPVAEGSVAQGRVEPGRPLVPVPVGPASAGPAPGGPGPVEWVPVERRPTTTGPTGRGPVDSPRNPAEPVQSGSRGEHLLQRAYGTSERADRFYREQVLDHLNDDMAAFVGRMELAFVATADANGESDCSLRAGPPGFIQVLGRRLLAYPEYRGNGVLASLGNISENPHVGILLVDFVRDLIGLHVNGRARIVEDRILRAGHPRLPAAADRGRTPQRWVLVDVREAYIHCRKHIPMMQPVPRTRDWGTDDVRRKGGDYFSVKQAAASCPATRP